MTHENLTVQIMAGGKSTRMGTDKAGVTLGGKTLLELAADKWRGFGAETLLSVGSAERKALARPGMRPVTDRYRSRGPLGGLHGGLLECATEFLLLTAVDCPFVTRELAEGLLSAIGEGDACVYTLEGRPQPLFGLYRKRCQAAVEGMLEEGENRMVRLLHRVNTVYLPTDDPAPFRNLNTPEELAAARDIFVENENEIRG